MAWREDGRREEKGVVIGYRVDEMAEVTLTVVEPLPLSRNERSAEAEKESKIEHTNFCIHEYTTCRIAR